MTRYYDDVEMGDDMEPEELVATDAAVEEFCEVWGNPGAGRFTDNEAAKSEGLHGAIVPGILSMAYMARFVTRWAEGGSLKKLDVVFRQMVFHEIPLRLVGVITDKNELDGENQVECDIYLETADGDRLVGGKATAVLPSKQ